MAAALAAFCGAVQADGITSANTVGYSGTTINADQWYLVGVQFADVSSVTETADFNSLISTTCTPGTIGDFSDPTWNNAPIIQVLKANGQSYDFYYYIDDADDGNGNYTATAWVDTNGMNLTRLSTFASKTPAFAGVLLVGLHYTVVSTDSAASLEIFGGGWAGNVSSSRSTRIARSGFGST